MRILIFFGFFALFMMASSVSHAEEASPELIAKGRDLFNNKEGLQVKFACILCHKQDKAVQKSAIEKAGDQFPAVINKYITEKSKGKALAADSQEMQALMAYIRHEHSK